MIKERKNRFFTNFVMTIEYEKVFLPSCPERNFDLLKRLDLFQSGIAPQMKTICSSLFQL